MAGVWPMARLEVRGDEVEIHLSVVEEVLALHGSLRIPLQHVTGAVAGPVPPALWRGFRIGANIPGVLVAGTFLTGDGAVFYDMRRGERCVTLQLSGERYTSVVIELDADQDPEAVVREILSRHGRG
jgi:hypothetical protein